MLQIGLSLRDSCAVGLNPQEWKNAGDDGAWVLIIGGKNQQSDNATSGVVVAFNSTGGHIELAKLKEDRDSHACAKYYDSNGDLVKIIHY